MKEMELIKKALNNSTYTVALCSTGLLQACGLPSMREQYRAYSIETKYGYSPEEIFSTVFFSTRPEKFFDYYRNEVLPGYIKPDESFHCIKELEDRNLIQYIITNNVCGFLNQVGCKSVLDLHGNIQDNVCTSCGKKFPVEHIMNSDGIPLCDECGKIVRPEVLLFGEMVDNQKMTRAINEISRADVLLVIGCNLNTPFIEKYIKYFKGSRLILIKPEANYKDLVADVVINQPIKSVLEELVASCPGR